MNRSRLLGMTLIEVLVGLAITTLMTVAGWRAIEALQSARDQTYRDANQWQTLDTLFTTLEADLRRAEFANFSGNTTTLSLRLNPLTTSDASESIRYVVEPIDDRRIRVLREAPTGGIVMSELESLSFKYRKASRPGEAMAPQATIDEYPRAVEIAAIVPGNDPDVKRAVTRVLVLR